MAHGTVERAASEEVREAAHEAWRIARDLAEEPGRRFRAAAAAADALEDVALSTQYVAASERILALIGVALYGQLDDIANAVDTLREA